MVYFSTISPSPKTQSSTAVSGTFFCVTVQFWCWFKIYFMYIQILERTKLLLLQLIIVSQNIFLLKNLKSLELNNTSSRDRTLWKQYLDVFQQMQQLHLISQREYTPGDLQYIVISALWTLETLLHITKLAPSILMGNIRLIGKEGWTPILVLELNCCVHWRCRAHSFQTLSKGHV